jgi:hypothetical protein
MATSAGATRPADQIAFAHNSERQFARLLDFYRVEWEYEPTAFPIEWDAAGQPVQLFRPDFYLPRFGLYIEITTLNQRLVTKKNRKVRRLRELYPDVRIKVLYQRDYLSLLAKYGLERPSQMTAPEEATGPDPGRGRADSAAGAPEPPAAAERPPERPREAPPGRVADRPPRGQPGGAEDRVPEQPGGAGEPPRGQPGGAVERARAAGRPRVVPNPPQRVPPLPADPELVRLAQVPLPAEAAQRRRPAATRRAG